MAKYIKFKQKAVAALRLLLSDPVVFKKILIQKFSRNKVNQYSGINQDLESILLQIKKKAFNNILVISDKNFFQKLGNNNWVWCSLRPEDNSESIVNIDIRALDGAIVGGADVKAAYIYLIKRLKRLDLVLPVFWVGNGFEYSGSTVPLIEEVENANIYLFNHYAEFFSLKDPLLVKATFKDEKKEIDKLYILNPNETLKININSIFPNRCGDTVVSFFTSHPILTRGRHTRWRLWADVFYKNSFASSHGAHDYGSSHINAGFIVGNGVDDEKIILTLPNYDGNLALEEKTVLVRKDQEIQKIIRTPEKWLDRVEFNILKDINYGFRYLGKGETFLYFINNPSTDLKNIMFNHNSTQSMFKKKLSIIDEGVDWVSKLVDQGFLIQPHALPVLGESHLLEFGFSFDSNNPPVSEFIIHLFDVHGEILKIFSYTKNFIGNLYANEIINGVADLDNVGLIIICPDFFKMRIDPSNISMIGNLVIRNKTSLDQDFTEFQSCWRNIGHLIPQLPHWLHPMKGLIGTSNLVGRVLAGFGFRTGITLVNASGNIDYDVTAVCAIKVFNPYGAEITKEIEVLPFQAHYIWLDELFIGLDQFLNSGYGSCIISSADADLNVQIFTTENNYSVALQHLWGY